ncbi:MAG: hypothetical protein AAF399_16105 [Bacteroidota bacterium]
MKKILLLLLWTAGSLGSMSLLGQSPSRQGLTPPPQTYPPTTATQGLVSPDDFAFPATADPRVLRQQQRVYKQWQKDQQKAQRAARRQQQQQKQLVKQQQQQTHKAQKAQKASQQALHQQQRQQKRAQQAQTQQARKFRKQGKQQQQAAKRQQQQAAKQQQQAHKANRQQQQQWKAQQAQQQQAARKLKKAKPAPASLPVYTAASQPPPLHPLSYRKRFQSSHIKQLLQISPRFQYGIGSYWANMTYPQPDLTVPVDNALSSLQGRFPWVPWSELDLVEGDPMPRERKFQTHGKFFGVAGVNLPVIFIELEAGSGRFQQPQLSLGDFWPISQGFSLRNLGELMVERVSKGKPSNGAATLRIGVDLERLLPEHKQLKWQRNRLALGLDASVYYFGGVDLSYRPGVELLNQDFAEKVEALLDPIPLVSATKKAEASEAITQQIDQHLPAYFWVPALRGVGFIGRTYLDVGRFFRFQVAFHYERGRGLKLPNSEWLQAGPVVNRRFLTLSVSRQL